MSLTKSVTILKKDQKNLLKFFPNGIISIDLETTGLSPMIDKIIEVGAVKVTPDGVSEFQELVNPEIPIPANTTKIHGINDSDVVCKRTIHSVLPELINFIGDLPIVAHNAKFDLGYIIFNMRELDIKFDSSSKVYCSCTLSRQVFRKIVQNHKLVTIAKHFEIPLENHHRALDDASAGLQVFAKELEKLKDDSKEVITKELKKGYLFKVSDFNPDMELTLPDHLKPIKEDIPTQTPIEIFYMGGSSSNRKKFRPVKPVSLLIMPNGQFLYAKCLLTNIYKSFALNKIKEVRKILRDA